MSDVDVDVKTKYIDITQLPVAEDENSVLIYEYFERLREELNRPNRRYEFEGDWSMQYEIGSIEPEWKFIGKIRSIQIHDVAHNISGYCTPSRNFIMTLGFNGAL